MQMGCPRSMSGVHIPSRKNRLLCSACGGPIDGKQARDDAMSRARAHADPEFAATALGVVHDIASRQEYLTADDVWEGLDGRVSTHDNRALGPILDQAKVEGWIDPTDRHIPTRRADNHARPIRVWRSRLYQGRTSQ